MPISRGVTGLLAAALAVLAASCAGRGSDGHGGQGPRQAAFRIEAVSPSLGFAAGGTTVRLSGAGFEPGAQATFGGIPASGVVADPDGRALVCVTPPHPTDVVDVVVTNPGGESALLEAGYTYLVRKLCPTVLGVDPGSFPETGGVPIRVTGLDFEPGAEVFFGGGFADPVTFVSSTELVAIAPEMPPGLVGVTVQNPGGCADTLLDSMTVLWSYTKNCSGKLGVTPRVIDPAGGEEVTLTMRSIPNVVKLGRFYLNGVEATATHLDDRAIITTPPLSPGPVDLVASAGSETIRLTDTLHVLDPQGTGPVAAAISPPSAPRHRDALVVIRGDRFPASPRPEVWFGGQRATGVVSLDPQTLLATAPWRSCPGRVDVTVTDPSTGESWTMAEGFEYERVPGDMPVPVFTGYAPRCGSPSYFELSPAGYPRDLEVWFGNAKAEVTWVFDYRIRVNVPPLGEMSRVDVRFSSPSTGCEVFLPCGMSCW